MKPSILEKLLILKLLFDDDEPLNLILKEALITEANEQILNANCRGEQISTEHIKYALSELKNFNMIELISEDGEKLECDDNKFNQLLNSSEEWKYWFRITKSGEKFFNDNQQAYFQEGSFN